MFTVPLADSNAGQLSRLLSFASFSLIDEVFFETELRNQPPPPASRVPSFAKEF
jgi:hypothetical protein